MILEEHDMIRVIEDVIVDPSSSSSILVKKGTIGAIVSIYNSGEAFAVELDGADSPVVTLYANNIELVCHTDNS